ncbi:hypothetical protein L1987_73762 [Smallanthus sonchifolius]|uniref:Uncharacterized protein n=1 Tax=Smallanthus sonchifolius TaxID=185202 RepID=A0ACB9A1T7_9ASTR|nr:hypothetical protein L1987_73762 [Smallanthus sonchifolius]
MAPAKEQYSSVITTVVGTPGYCDPLYQMTLTLTKESDTLSVWSYSKFYVGNYAVRIAMVRFSRHCVSMFEEYREDRPKMAEVVTELEIALESQEFVKSEKLCEWKEPVSYYEEITKDAQPPINYRTTVKLWLLLSKGVVLDYSDRWFSLDKNGKKCHMVSTTAAGIEGERHRWRSLPKSRFGEVVELKEQEFKIFREINYQLVSSQTYATYLVYKLPRDQSIYKVVVKQTLRKGFPDRGRFRWCHCKMDPSPSNVDRRMKKPADHQRDPDFWPLSGKPYFYVVLRNSHLAKTYRMNIPRNLAEKLPVARVPAKIVYRGKVWDLLYLGDQGITNCRLENQTWAKFVTDNNLEVGDACVFELMEGNSNSKSIKFKLQILKDEFPTELVDKAEGGNVNNPISID